jgi:hypothetical protein
VATKTPEKGRLSSLHREREKTGIKPSNINEAKHALHEETSRKEKKTKGIHDCEA